MTKRRYSHCYYRTTNLVGVSGIFAYDINTGSIVGLRWGWLNQSYYSKCKQTPSFMVGDKILWYPGCLGGVITWITYSYGLFSYEIANAHVCCETLCYRICD